MNLGIFGNIFGFFLFLVKNSNFHIQTTGICKVVVGRYYLLFYQFKWTICDYWNHIFHESRYFWLYFWIFLIFLWKSRLFTFKLRASPNLVWDVGSSSSITLYGLYLNIGIIFFLNLDIFGNSFEFFLVFVKKSNFHIQSTGISKLIVGYWYLLFYHLR